MTMNFKRIEALMAAAAVLALAGCSSVELDESLKKGTTQEDAVRALPASMNTRFTLRLTATRSIRSTCL